MNGTDPLLLTLAVVVIGFLVLRALVLWYFRIPDVIRLLTDIREELRLIRTAESHPTNATPSTIPGTTNGAPTSTDATARGAARSAPREPIKWPE